MKPKRTTTSLIVALFSIIVLSLILGFMYRQMRERLDLINQNDNERILTALIASLRDHSDFGSAINAGSLLHDRVAGIAVYLDDGTALYTWGSAPETFTQPTGPELRGEGPGETPGRWILPDRRSGTFRFIINTSKMRPPPPQEATPESGMMGNGMSPRHMENRERRVEGPRGFFFDVFGKGEWLWIDIRHQSYWRELRLLNILFPAAWLLLCALILYVRHLGIRNAEYRDRIEAQKNLVVLGTAASTLAHEIKNPLLAIRLQTGIIRKLRGEDAGAELDIIDSEVDRLSALTYRINDYLREGRGSPEALDAAAAIDSITSAMCGRSLLAVSSASGLSVSMDRERFRSVVENLVRNALESGGSEAEVSVEVSRRDGRVEISVLDRGRGIKDKDAARVFEPFFTTKSKGTGIGLAISRRFVEAAEGTITLSAREGGGTRALVSLPEGTKR